MNPQNQVVLITGASSGIGAATAQVFAAAGATLVLAARSVTALTELAARLPGSPLIVPTDISDAYAVRALVDQTVQAYGRLNILINNAGVGLAGPVTSLAAADLERVLAVNLLGPLSAIQAAVPVMQQQGRGQIINISSVLGITALPYLGGYAASKAALDRLTEALRMELLSSGIRVTLVRPGTTRTDFAQRRLGQGHERRRFSPRGVAPDVVARAVLRAAHKEPRVAYVSLQDRLQVLLATVAPRLTERVLAHAFTWEEE